MSKADEVVQCSLCAWSWSGPTGPHQAGCYHEGKWRKWISKKEFDTPRVCGDFKPLEVEIISDSPSKVRVVNQFIGVDVMRGLFDMQREIMAKVPDPSWDLEMMHKITCALGTIEEAIEYINSIGRKPWRPQPLLPDVQLEELSDGLHFFIEQIIRSGFTWEQVVERYKRKHAENLERYRRGAEGDFSWDNRAEKGEL